MSLVCIPPYQLVGPSYVSAADAAAKLLLHFDGSNGATSFPDSGSVGIGVTATNASISTSQSKFGGASVSFGGNGYLTLDASASLTFGTGDFTVEFWINSNTGLDAIRRFITSANGAFTANTFYIRSQSGLIAIGGFGTYSTFLTAGNWYHIAFQRQGTTGTLYKDGVAVLTAACTTNYNEAVRWIGGYYTLGPAEFFSGYMDEIRISNVARYSGNFTPATSPFPNTLYIPTPTATPAAMGDALEGGFYSGMIWNELVNNSQTFLNATGTKSLTVPGMDTVPLVYQGQALEMRSRSVPTDVMTCTVISSVGTTLTLNCTGTSGVANASHADWSVMAKYRVIVSPKAQGESASKAISTTGASLAATQTLSEGKKATAAMLAAGNATQYPAAYLCAGLNIAGYADWYVPSRDELELCYRNLKPTADGNRTASRAVSAINYANLGSYNDSSTVNGTNLNSSPQGTGYTASVPGQVAAGKNFRTGETQAFEYIVNGFYLSCTESAAGTIWQTYYDTRSLAGSQERDRGKAEAWYVRAIRRSII